MLTNINIYNDMDNNEHSYGADLAEGTFLKKWPEWVRWAFFIPAAAIFSFIGVALYRLITAISNVDGYSGSILFEIVSSAILGALFVYIGSLVAPRHQFIVSVVLLIIVTIFAVISFLFGLLPGADTGPVLTAIYDVAMLIGSVIVVVWVKNEVK